MLCWEIVGCHLTPPCYDKAIAKELGTLASGCRNMDRYRRRLIQKEGGGRGGREGERKG